MTEVGHAGSEQQPDAGSNANRPGDEGAGRCESDAGEPVGRDGEYGPAHYRLRQTNTAVTT
jgi:hypothetical protein